jgi:Sulfotransferase family
MKVLPRVNEYISSVKRKHEYRSYVQPFLKNNRLKKSEPSADKMLAVFSSPRGGSTWMAELLSAIPQSAIVWEPLDFTNIYPELTEARFTQNQYIPEHENWPEAKKYFSKLFSMQIDAFGLYAENRCLRELPASSYFIFKFVGANLLLPWLTSLFTGRFVYIIRHPCAVISSQLRYKFIRNEIEKEGHQIFPEGRFHDQLVGTYSDIIKRAVHNEERLAAEWALTNLIPVTHTANDIRWITVAYERLYKDPAAELDRLFSRLKIGLPPDLLANIKKNSSTALASSAESIQSGQQLHAWKGNLSRRQIDNILGIVKEFGIDFYDESPEPDYTRLYRDYNG